MDIPHSKTIPVLCSPQNAYMSDQINGRSKKQQQQMKIEKNYKEVMHIPIYF